MNTHIPQNLFSPSYLKSLTLTPSEAQYLLYLNENIPDMSRTGVADPNLRTILTETVSIYWMNVAGILEHRKNLVARGESDMPDFFTEMESARIKTFRFMNSLLDDIHKQHITCTAFEDVVAYSLGIQSIMGGARKILNERASDYKQLLEGLTWDKVGYDQYRQINERTLNAHNDMPAPDLNRVCREHGIGYITCSSTMKNSMLADYVNDITVAADNIVSKFNWEDPAMFGGFGYLGVELHTYMHTNTRGTQDHTGKMTLSTNGADVVSHEWMHFYDNLIGRTNNVFLESEHTHKNTDAPLSMAMEELLEVITPSDKNKHAEYNKRNVATTVKDLVNAIKHKDLYALKSEIYDITSALTKDRYWNKRSEKLARAFEAYITDGYSKFSYAYPPQIKKTAINNAFDKFISETGPILESFLIEQSMRWHADTVKAASISVPKPPKLPDTKNLYHANHSAPPSGTDYTSIGLTT